MKINKMLSLDAEIVELLRKESNASDLCNELLKAHFAKFSTNFEQLEAELRQKKLEIRQKLREIGSKKHILLNKAKQSALQNEEEQAKRYFEREKAYESNLRDKYYWYQRDCMRTKQTPLSFEEWRKG